MAKSAIETTRKIWNVFPKASKTGGKFAFDKAALRKPLTVKTPTTFFIGGAVDLFGDAVKQEWIDQVFAVIALTPQHTYQIVTDRADYMRNYFTKIPGQSGALASARCIGFWKYKISGVRPENDYLPIDLPLPNVWLGVRCSDQQTADEQVPLLLETTAAIRFVVCEPLLGQIDLTRIPTGSWAYGKVDVMTGYLCGDEPDEMTDWNADPNGWIRKPANEWTRGKHGVDWVIAGGQSSGNAYPVNPEWIRSIRNQCQAAGVPFFFNGWGDWLPVRQNQNKYELENWIDGENTATLIYPVESGDFKDVGDTPMCKVGSRYAGRILDGKTWDEFPL